MKRSPRTLATSVAATLLLLTAACSSDTATPAPAPAPAPVPAPGAPAAPEPTHDYKDGDVITIVLSTGAGGGFDTHLQIIAAALPDAIREIAGVNVTVRTEPMPGGGHALGTEFVNGAAPDGLTLLYTSGTQMASNFIFQGAAYNPRMMTAIADVGTITRAFAVRPGTPVSSMREMIEYRENGLPPLLVSVGQDTTLVIASLLLKEYDDIDWEYTSVGLASIADGTTAILRGDADIIFSGTSSLVIAAEDNPADLEMAFGWGCEREDEFPDIPVITEEDLRAARPICETLGGTQRIIMGPPGMNPATVALLEEAFLRVGSTDPYLGRARESGLHTAFRGREALLGMIEATVNVFETYEDEVRELIG